MRNQFIHPVATGVVCVRTGVSVKMRWKLPWGGVEPMGVVLHQPHSMLLSAAQTFNQKKFGQCTGASQVSGRPGAGGADCSAVLLGRGYSAATSCSHSASQIDVYSFWKPAKVLFFFFFLRWAIGYDFLACPSHFQCLAFSVSWLQSALVDSQRGGEGVYESDGGRRWGLTSAGGSLCLGRWRAPSASACLQAKRLKWGGGTG